MIKNGKGKFYRQLILDKVSRKIIKLYNQLKYYADRNVKIYISRDNEEQE